jgi:hypothetical protein
VESSEKEGEMMKCLFLYGFFDGQMRDVCGHGFPPKTIAMVSSTEATWCSNPRMEKIMYERVEFVEDGESFFFYRAAGETGSLIERMIELTQETE